jgi:integrase
VAASRGQILKREYGFLVRIYIGRDSIGTRSYQNQKVTGTKKDAEKVLTAMLRKLDTGELLHEPSRLSVKEYLEHWLETAAKPRLTEHTHTEYGNLMRRYIVPALSSRKLTKVAPVDIQKVYSEMLGRGLSARVVRYTHAVFSNALKQAVKWRMASHNPAQYVDLPKQERKEMQALSEAEAVRFLKAAKTDKHHVLFALLLSTGLRPGEAFGLKWVDLDAFACTLTVQRTWARANGGYKFQAPKTKRSRRCLDLPEHLVRLLLEHKALQSVESEMIFSTLDGTPLGERNVIVRHFKPLLKAAGLPETLRLYDLRHTHATLLLQAGTHPKIVSERLGHASITLTLDTYSHVLPGMQRESASKLNAMLFAGDAAEPRAFN